MTSTSTSQTGILPTFTSLHIFNGATVSDVVSSTQFEDNGGRLAIVKGLGE